MDQIIILIYYVLIFASAFILVAYGGMFSERSGVINIGLEGTMAVGGMCGVLALKGMVNASLPAFLVVIITILVAIGSGMLYSLLLAFVCIHLKADQTLIGTALNLISTALCMIVVKIANSGVATEVNYTGLIRNYPNNPFFIPLGNLNVSIFFIIAIVAILVAQIGLYKTRFGLRLMACGENPSAADSVGINVFKYRYTGVLISGALAGLGAIAYIVPVQSFWNADAGVSGFGFLALAIMIFGAWKPTRIALASFLFALFMSLSYIYSTFFQELFGITLNASNGFTSDLFKMLPYIMSLILLSFTSKNSRAPKSEGIPYDKGRR